LSKLNRFQSIFGKPLKVSSGYRPAEINIKNGGAKKSNHILCLACDFVDPLSELDLFCIQNQDVLEKCDLYLEHPKWTKGWCHLQAMSPVSGKRIFVPSTVEPTDGKLDKLFIDLVV
jgi:hypothetical protein